MVMTIDYSHNSFAVMIMPIYNSQVVLVMSSYYCFVVMVMAVTIH